MNKIHLIFKTHLDDYENYSSVRFQQARRQPNFQKMEASWDEKRGYLRSALICSGSRNRPAGCPRRSGFRSAE